MKKITIMISIVFSVVALSGCTQTKTPKATSYNSEINALDAEMNSLLLAEQGLDLDTADLEALDFSSTDELDFELDKITDDELQIDQELNELESMDF